MNIGQSAIQTIVVVGKPLVIETKKVERGRIKIPHRHRIDRRTPTELVSGADRCATLHPSPHHPTSESVRVMIAAGHSRLMGWHPAKLGCPQYKRFIK